MRIAMRVDASSRIGTGHLKRSLSLAQALHAVGAQVRFVTRALGIESAEQIAEAGFEDTIVLPAPDGEVQPDPDVPHSAWAEVPQAQDSAETAAALAQFAPAKVVVDSYAFDARWHDAVRTALGCGIVLIDDMADRQLAPDLLIDHNFAPDHRAKYAGCLRGTPRILSGPRFALLGKAYAEAERYRFGEEVRSIGVFMGGVDAGNHSSVVLDALDQVGFYGPVEVVSTSANPNLSALRDQIAAREGATLSLDLPDLADFFARHDLQVGAGGGATWERCCIGVPTVLVVTSPNQNAVAPALDEAGVAVMASEPTASAIAARIEPLLSDATRRRAMADASRALVDGRGAERAALAILAEILKVRPATFDDARMMFEWRNDPANRQVSRTSDPIAWEAHCEWLEKVIADPSRKLFVGEIGSRAVGIIRFDFCASDRAEVSLYLNTAHHGTGLGPPLLLRGEEAADARVIDATVLPDNRPSQRLFESCSYRRVSEQNWIKER